MRSGRDRPSRALQAQRAALAPDRRSELAAPHSAAGREAERPTAPSIAPRTFAGRRLRRGALRHHRPRGRLTRACVRVRADVPGIEHQSERRRVRVPPGHRHQTAWLDPGLPSTFERSKEVLAGVAAIFPGPYIHIGGDEPYGMPHDLYASYVRRVRDLVRSLGRRPLGWQESARAGLGPGDMIQYWFSDIALPLRRTPRSGHRWTRTSQSLAATSRRQWRRRVRHRFTAEPLLPRRALRRAVGRSWAGGEAGRVGLRLYSPKTVVKSFDWKPAETLGPGRAAQVGGVEAANCAETISGLDDCPSCCTSAGWRRPEGLEWPAGTAWTDHRHRLARHGRLWAQDNSPTSAPPPWTGSSTEARWWAPGSLQPAGPGVRMTAVAPVQHARSPDPLCVDSAGQAGRHRRPARRDVVSWTYAQLEARGEPAGQRARLARRRPGREGDLVRAELAAGRRRHQRRQEDRGGRGAAELPPDRRGGAATSSTTPTPASPTSMRRTRT